MQSNNDAATRSLSLSPRADELFLDAAPPWPGGIPDLDTVRSALSNRVRTPGLPPSLVEIEQSFDEIDGGPDAECLRMMTAVRWRLAAAVSIAPGGKGFQFRQVAVDEAAAAALQAQCQDVMLSLVALSANSPDGDEIDRLRARFEKEFANFREVLKRTRQRAESAPASTSTEAARQAPSTPAPNEAAQSQAMPYLEAPATLMEQAEPRKRPYVLAFMTAVTLTATLWSFLWPVSEEPPPIPLPDDVPREKVIVGKDGAGVLFSPDGSPIQSDEAERYAKSFKVMGTSVIEAAPGQYVLVPSNTVDNTAPIVKSY